ncbi:hypothetical protein HNR46_002556 [Haloferula luteola]|uniref:Uncharacterized protein n=1 Tax=Haloferula luteola TaxID=595692 RepID=A0A840VHV0_9BACT|nr:hypothetical protein [Haloferula luteola]MBB5352311.1 hypothetical protein [Haloferula luteola]
MNRRLNLQVAEAKLKMMALDNRSAILEIPENGIRLGDMVSPVNGDSDYSVDGSDDFWVIRRGHVLLVTPDKETVSEIILIDVSK